MPDREPRAELQFPKLTVIIGASGIGRYMARESLALGAVVVVDEQEDGIIDELEATKNPVLFLPLNIGDRKALEEACLTVESRLRQPIDEIVNCTGIQYEESIHGRTVIGWQESLQAMMA